MATASKARARTEAAGNPGIPAHAPGISFVIGIKGKGSSRVSKVQSVLFGDRWTQATAKVWLKEHGFKYGQVDDVAGNMLRFRQEDPQDFDDFRTIKPDRRANKKRNPEAQSAEMYESFHGSPSTGITEVVEEEHYHGNLAELGELVELGVETLSGYEVTLTFSDDNGKKHNPGRKRNLWPFSSFTKTTIRHVGTGRKYGVVGHARGYAIYKREGHEGEPEYVVPKLDPESRFESLSEAKRFIGAQAKGNPGKQGPLASSMKLVGEGMNAIMRADSKLGKALNPSQDRFLLFNVSLQDSPPDENGTVRGTLVRVSRGTPVEVLQTKKHRMLVKADLSGRPLWGWTDDSNVSARAKYRSTHGEDPEEMYRTNPDHRQSGPVLLCSSEDGEALFLIGGNQEVDLAKIHMDGDWEKESMILGECFFVSYLTQKDFDQDKPTIYEHSLGEETGECPMLRYDSVNKRLHLDGGQYRIEKPLWKTSDGIEN